MIDLRVFILAIVLAFGGGFYVKGVFTDAGETKTLRVEAKQSAGNIVAAVADNARIEAAAQKTSDTITTIKSEVAKRGITLHPRQGPSNEPARHPDVATDTDPRDDHPSCPGSDALVLDLGTVGLLNAARQGRPVDPAGGSDEAFTTPSTVGVPALVDNDLEIVRLYLELAKRHDELVDAVEGKLRDQAK